jgi:cell division protein FtsW (lipid II flippase)
LQLAYLALASLLTLEVVRFSPNRFSKLLVYHLLNHDDNWLHMHTIEILELAVLLVICWLAKATIKHEIQVEKPDAAPEIESSADSIQA